MTADLDTAQIAEQLTCCAARLDPPEQRLGLRVFRALAKGEPVEPARLADQTDLTAAEVMERLRRGHGLHTDDQGRIVAFEGLSVVETAHRLRVDGRTLYAWCAWDTLFLPELIGRPAKVESTCPATGATITLRVEPTGPQDVYPDPAVVSFLLPDRGSGDDTIASFCNFVHFFASRRAAEEWTAARPGTFVISIEEAFEIGRMTNAAQLGDALRASGD